MEIIIGILIPFIGTCLGSLLVYFIHKELNKNIENCIYGLASGVMIAASIWSLLIPAIELTKGILIFPVIIGFTLGIVVFCFYDIYLMKKSDHNIMIAMTIHNIPEGMAVGICFASYLMGLVTLSSCYVLTLGIALQNFPEGTVVSLPLLKKGYSKNKAFLYGVLSAFFELLGAVITLMFTSIVKFIFPYFLSFAAGAMFYVVIHELIPESSDGTQSNTYGFLLGFLIMMILDVYLG